MIHWNSPIPLVPLQENMAGYVPGGAVLLEQIHGFVEGLGNGKECCRKERSHAVPAMPYDPGEQGAPMHSEAPDEEGQREESRIAKQPSW